MSEKSFNAVFILIMLALAAYSATHWDSQVSAYFADPPNQHLKELALMITDAGLGGTYYILAIIMYFGGDILMRRIRILSNYPIKHMGRYLLWTLAGTGIVNSLIKFAVGRERPYHSPQFAALNFQPWNFKSDFQSFPSGHTQVVFTLAAFLCYFFPRYRVLWLSFAIIIGISRMGSLYHFPSDVICGGLVGWYISTAIMRRLDAKVYAQAAKALAAASKVKTL